VACAAAGAPNDPRSVKVDTKLKDEQRRWEPVKAMSAAFGAGVAFASGLIALAAWVLTHFIQATVGHRDPLKEPAA
jgi:hypothetical protein